MTSRVAQVIMGFVLLGIALSFLFTVLVMFSEGFPSPLSFPYTIIIGLSIIPILYASYKLFFGNRID